MVICAESVTIADKCAGFKSKKIRINLNVPIKAEQKAEATDVLKTVDEDRKYVIQATIVRCVSVVSRCTFFCSSRALIVS